MAKETKYFYQFKLLTSQLFTSIKDSLSDSDYTKIQELYEAKNDEEAIAMAEAIFEGTQKTLKGVEFTRVRVLKLIHEEK